MSDLLDPTDPTDGLPEEATDSDPAGGMRFPALSTWAMRLSLLAGVAVTLSPIAAGPPTSSMV